MLGADPEAWARIPDPEERLRGALAQTYAYHRRTEPMTSKVLRDARVHAPTFEASAPYRRRWDRRLETLLAALGHAYRNGGTTAAGMLATISPPGFERYSEEPAGGRRSEMTRGPPRQAADLPVDLPRAALVHRASWKVGVLESPQPDRLPSAS